MVKRGEIWLIDLDPTIGSEIRKTRPCVIISPAEMHDHLRTVIVAPMTTGSKAAPFRVPIGFQDKRGLVLYPRTLLGKAPPAGAAILAFKESGVT